MKIKFLGAAGTVTGSGYVLTANSGASILIDLGMFQGPEEIENLNYAGLQLEAEKLAGVILTHAHLDHCGRLPMIMRMGFEKNVYLTPPTANLTYLSLLDSAKIAAEDHPENILYNSIDVENLVSKFLIFSYHENFKIGEFEVVFRDAGHILGSASVEILVDGQKIVFSGDLGNTPEPLVKPTEKINQADIVVMESTYGDRMHPTGVASDIVCDEINMIENNQGTLLIPAFSLERTQEILHIISHLKSQNRVKRETAVFLDSPMAEKATEIYEKYVSFMNDEIKADFSRANPFDFPGLRVTKDRKESLKIAKLNAPKVIIAGGGMMTGGRIVSHARHFLSKSSTRLLIVGYQGEGTLGRKLLERQQVVRIGQQQIQVSAHITDIQTMSSHADQGQLMNWLTSISEVKKVILTHGEDEPRKVLADKIKGTLGLSDIILPSLNQEVVI